MSSNSNTGNGVAIGGILIAIFVVLLCGVIPLALLLPSINRVRTGTGSSCLSNMRQLALAAANHESATKHYPVASHGTTDLLKGQTAGGHGDAPSASDDGFSWLYALLPYIEENIVRREMQKVRDQDDVQTGPFDADFVNTAGKHFATMQMSAFRCSNYSGPATTTIGGVEAAVANYYAIVGTDLADPNTAAWKKTPNWENGVLTSQCWRTPNSQATALTAGTCNDRGVTLRELSDGISKTIIITESREPTFNAWISGASMWVVAATPNSLASAGATIGPHPDDDFIAILQGNTTPTSDGGGLAIDFGTNYSARPAAEHYLQASDWATGLNRRWGPSSDHAGGVVIHAFADAHVQAISPHVDPTVYLRLITRRDGEPIEVEAFD